MIEIECSSVADIGTKPEDGANSKVREKCIEWKGFRYERVKVER